MKTLKILRISFVFLLLTFVSQVGGVIYLLSRLLYKCIDHRVERLLFRKLAHILLFLLIYSFATFVIIPPLAGLSGRVPLPMRGNLKPLNLLTCFLNRHYVKPVLKEIAIETADKMNKKYQGTRVCYLDANFPFIDGFPLIPHLSHNDGRKLDLALFYKDRTGAIRTNETPSFIGYGVSEAPTEIEQNMPAHCEQQGYWQYNLLTYLVPQWNKAKFRFDEERTREMVKLFSEAPAIGKIFLEPHLKSRMKLAGNKIVFHGCHAVRHDDHIHIQTIVKP